MTWRPGEFIASPQAAEEFAALHMRRLGFSDATRTPTGPDGGVDVRSAGGLAQVKNTSTQVGRPEIQRLVGARGRRSHLELLFYAAAGYSRAAVEYANEMDIALFTYDVRGKSKALNLTAAKLVKRTAAAGNDHAYTIRRDAEGRVIRASGTTAEPTPPRRAPTDVVDPSAPEPRVAEWVLGTVFAVIALGFLALAVYSSAIGFDAPGLGVVAALFLCWLAWVAVRRIRRVRAYRAGRTRPGTS